MNSPREEVGDTTNGEQGLPLKRDKKSCLPMNEQVLLLKSKAVTLEVRAAFKADRFLKASKKKGNPDMMVLSLIFAAYRSIGLERSTNVSRSNYVC